MLAVLDRVVAMKRPDIVQRAASGDDRLTRLVRIVLVCLVVFAIEWRLADPNVVAADPALRPMPWAVLALLAPMALGVWTFELATRERPGPQADLLWGVLIASLGYVGALLLAR